MAKEKNKGRVTLANIIAVIGVALLGMALFLGYRLDGDNMGISIMKAAAWAAGFTLLLWLLIKAKGAKSGNRGMWRMVEAIALILYLGAAVLSSPQVARFFDTYAQAGKLKEAASNDVSTLRHAISDFQSNESEALQETVRGMRNLIQQRADDDMIGPELAEFLHNYFPDLDETFSDLTESKVNAFENAWQTTIDELIDNDQNTYAESWEERLDDCNEQIQNWNVMQISDAIGSMEGLTEEIGSTLEQISATLPFATINRQDNGQWNITDIHQSYEADLDTELAYEAASVKKFSPVGIGACVLIHLLILFNYFVAFRSRYVRPSSKTDTTNDGGTLLTIND